MDYEVIIVGASVAGSVLSALLGEKGRCVLLLDKAHFPTDGDMTLLAPRLHLAEPAAEVKGAGNIPCCQRVPFGSGWALVGDAHQTMDPWSGMGIDHATTHAAFLADALDRWIREDATWQTAMHDYHAQARKWSEKTYRRTWMYAGDLRPMTRAALQRRGLI